MGETTETTMGREKKSRKEKLHTPTSAHVPSQPRANAPPRPPSRVYCLRCPLFLVAVFEIQPNLFQSQDLGFNAPLALICLTYLIMHLASLSIRWFSARRGGSVDYVDADEVRAGRFNYKPLLQQLTWNQWVWKVFPVAAASGLEVSGLPRLNFF